MWIIWQEFPGRYVGIILKMINENTTYLFNGRNLTNKVVGDSSHPLMRHYYPDHYGGESS